MRAQPSSEGWHHKALEMVVVVKEEYFSLLKNFSTFYSISQGLIDTKVFQFRVRMCCTLTAKFHNVTPLNAYPGR